MNTVYRVTWVYHAQQPTVTGTSAFKTVVNHKTFSSRANAIAFQKRLNNAYDLLVMPNRASLEEIALEDNLVVLESPVEEKKSNILVEWKE